MTERQAFARAQRRQSTAAETVIWGALRDRQHGNRKFRRQVPLGPYTVDFVCFAARLIVELDGPVHDSPEQRAHDRERDAWLASQGFRVLRFSNEMLLGGSGQLVLDAIERAIDAPLIRPGFAGPPSPTTGCAGGGEGKAP